MMVFKTLMTCRYGWSIETVIALNSIPIIFGKDKSVKGCWKEYYRFLCMQNPNQIESKQRSDAFYKLLESMANTLGYKKSINWEDIQNPYIPEGMAKAFDNSMVIQNSMAALLSEMLTSMVNNQAVQQEDIHSCPP